MKTQQDKIKKLATTLRLAKRALKHADAVMSYACGDKWEREVTQKDREAYAKLFEQVMGGRSQV